MNQDQSSTHGHIDTLETLGQTNLMLADPSQDIRGRTVVDANGEKLGKITELLVDSSQYKVRFLRVGSGGFLGIGREHVLIPVDAIESVTHDLVRINQTSQLVVGSPEYSPDLMTNEDFYRTVYNHYGHQPYWSPGYQYPNYDNRQGLGDREGGYSSDTAANSKPKNSR
jgi:sporulation protein YlmC with PRC-barrel domain